MVQFHAVEVSIVGYSFSGALLHVCVPVFACVCVFVHVW